MAINVQLGQNPGTAELNTPVPVLRCAIAANISPCGARRSWATPFMKRRRTATTMQAIGIRSVGKCAGSCAVRDASTTIRVAMTLVSTVET